MVTRLGDLQGVSGQVTAHGTITAQAAGVITAQVQGGVVSAMVMSGNITAHGQVTAGGQITAHGTVTAAISNVVTAEARGQITAVGTVTAAISNVVTAESRGQVTAVGTITAAISTVVTAESRGQVTAVGTVTAQVVGVVTAQMTAGALAVKADQAGQFAQGILPIVGMIVEDGSAVWGRVMGVRNHDAVNTAAGQTFAGVHEMRFNGITFDRNRNNATAVLLASASDVAGARTASDQVNYGHAGVVLHLNVYGTAATAIIGGLIVQAKHNDKYRTITAWASSITTAGLFSYALHPGAGAGSQYAGVCPVPLPRDWRAIVSGALDANASAAYQLDAHYVGYG